MSCAETPGPCTITEAVCNPNYDPTYSPNVVDLSNVFVQGYDNKLVMTWDGTIPIDPRHIVQFVYCEDPTPISYHDSPKAVDFIDGSMETGATLTQDTIVRLMYRVVNTANNTCNNWQAIYCVVDASWDSDAEIVFHVADEVFIGTDPVLHTAP